MAVGSRGRSLATLSNLEAQLAKRTKDQITGTLTLGLEATLQLRSGWNMSNERNRGCDYVPYAVPSRVTLTVTGGYSTDLSHEFGGGLFRQLDLTAR